MLALIFSVFVFGMGLTFFAKIRKMDWNEFILWSLLSQMPPALTLMLIKVSPESSPILSKLLGEVAATLILFYAIHFRFGIKSWVITGKLLVLYFAAASAALLVFG